MTIIRPQNYEVIVIGGGIIGAAIFQHLAQRGVDVCVIDSGRFGRRGATGTAGGLIRIVHAKQTLTKLAAESFQDFSQLRNDEDEPLYVQSGALFLDAEKNIESQQELVHSINKQYSLQLEILSAKELKQNFSHLINGLNNECAIFEPLSGYVDPVRVVEKWIGNGRRLGAAALEMTNVEGIEALNKREICVTTSIGKISARIVVSAMGAWTGKTNIPSISNHQLLTKGIQVNQIKKRTKFLHPIVVDETTGFFTRPSHDEFSIVGTTVNDWGLAPDAKYFASPTDDDLQLLVNRFPWLDGGTLSGARCGVDSYTPSSDGFMEWHQDIPQLFVTAGWSGCGIKIAPAVSNHIAATVNNMLQRYK